MLRICVAGLYSVGGIGNRRTGAHGGLKQYGDSFTSKRDLLRHLVQPPMRREPGAGTRQRRWSPAAQADTSKTGHGTTTRSEAFYERLEGSEGI